MKREQSLKLKLINCFDEPIRLPNVFVDITFFVQDRLCYAFRFGPTDGGGQIYITYNDVELQRQTAAKNNLMDYNMPLIECDEKVSIKIPSGDDLKAAYEWQNQYSTRSASPLAKLWLTAANKTIKADEKVFNLKSIETIIQIRCIIVN